MIQIGLGILVLLGAVVILMGAGDTLRLPVGDLFPLIGFGGTAVLVAFALLLIVNGLYRRRVRVRTEGRHRLRSLGLVWGALLLILFLALGMPLLVAPLNLIEVGGFPLGFYMAAQGALVALVALVFAVAWRQDVIDAEEGAAEDDGLPGAAGT